MLVLGRGTDHNVATDFLGHYNLSDHCQTVHSVIYIFLSGIETPDRNSQWYQYLLNLFAFFCFFTRAIPKGLLFGLCLYGLRLCNVHVLY